MIFGSWAEAATWLDNVCFDDLEVGTAVDEILHPELHEKIRVLVVEPKKEPRIEEISSGLESLQQAVGGYIEAVYPFEDPVAIICNEEGKLNGMDYNRAIRDENGEVQEIIAGPFLIVGLGEEDFTSLSEDMVQKYKRLFAQPEVFLQTQSSLLILPYAMDEFSSRDDGDLER